ncbi:MAG: hypothetical protein FWE33_07280 [Defluviitaleaceae bacterium]|nr:hypothetical protein [Defluviitaleaceae bacterium]
MFITIFFIACLSFGALMFLLRGAYSLLHKGDFERTLQITRKIATDIPDHKKFNLNHKAINRIWGFCLFGMAGAYAIAAIGIALEVMWIIIVAGAIFITVWFDGESRLRKYVKKSIEEQSSK